MKIKICGITNVGDALAAADLGAWAVGFIFYEKSPRYIAPARVREIVDKLPPRLQSVGVFVDATAAHIAKVRQESGVTHIQLHGNESPKFCGALDVPVIKALRAKTEQDIAKAAMYTDVELFLIDAAVDGQFGGTGALSDWELARTLKQHGKVLLSGGLNPLNVTEAIRSVEPFGVDVSSGVEQAPGQKSLEKLKLFFRNARGAS